MTDRKTLRKIGLALLVADKQDKIDYKAVGECGIDLQVMSFLGDSPADRMGNLNKGGFEICK